MVVYEQRKAASGWCEVQRVSGRSSGRGVAVGVAVVVELELGRDGAGGASELIKW